MNNTRFPINKDIFLTRIRTQLNSKTPVLATTASNPYSDTNAGGALGFVGGAGSVVLNGTIYFLTIKLAAA